MQIRDPDLLRRHAFLAGQWVDSDDGSRFGVRNPASGAEIAQVPDLGVAETRRAVDVAERAWPDWRARTAKERGAILHRWQELLLANQEDLAQLMTAECGKPLAESRSEVIYAAGFLEWFGEEAKRVYGDLIPSPLPDRRLLVLKQPIGVCAAITPWNFPLAMITRKCGPALAAGCPMLVKPAPQTPLSALALAELGARAGIPAGVFSVLTSRRDAEVGAELCANAKVRKLTFTGSTAVGKQLLAASAATLKKVSLELGGNAPFIVLDDADLDAAVQGAMASKYRNAGQTCVCANRLLIQDGIYQAFAERLVEAVQRLQVGDGSRAGVDQGPLISEAAVVKVERQIQDARHLGARVLTGGSRHPLGGTFFTPTVLADVNAGMRIAREETFGPVAPLFRFKADQEAIALANATEYGLAAYLYGRDLARLWRVAEALEYGMVGVNTGLISTEVAPFGGVKESGLGREGSRYGIEEYLEMKYLCLAGL